MQEFPAGSYWESLNHKGYAAGWIELLQAGILDDFVNSKIPVPSPFANPLEGYIITQDTRISNIIGIGEQLSQMAIYNSGTGYIYINIGTSPCIADLYSGVIMANGVETLIWNKIFSVTSPTSVYFWAYDWNGAILNCAIQTELIFI